jgi:hypothetical protein
MPGIFHTTVQPGEDPYDAIVRAGMEANRLGFSGYCIDCEKCGQPVDRHENPSDCDVWIQHFGKLVVHQPTGFIGRILPEW